MFLISFCYGVLEIGVSNDNLVYVIWKILFVKVSFRLIEFRCFINFDLIKFREDFMLIYCKLFVIIMILILFGKYGKKCFFLFVIFMIFLNCKRVWVI